MGEEEAQKNCQTVCFHNQSSVQTYQGEVLRVAEVWKTDCQTHPEEAHLTLSMWDGQLLQLQPKTHMLVAEGVGVHSPVAEGVGVHVLVVHVGQNQLEVDQTDILVQVHKHIHQVDMVLDSWCLYSPLS